MLFTGLRFHLSPGDGGADRNRPVDSGPGSEVNACVDVGVFGMPAGPAAERCLGEADGGDVSTSLRSAHLIDPTPGAGAVMAISDWPKGKSWRRPKVLDLRLMGHPEHEHRRCDTRWKAVPRSASGVQPS
jgi:hypothetical protein